MSSRPSEPIQQPQRCLRIDAHHHLWRFTPRAYGWIGENMQPLRRDFLLPELEHAIGSAGVDGTVAVQARETMEETDWLLALAQPPSPILGVVGWLPLAADDFEHHLQRYANASLLKGLRHGVQGEPAGFLEGAAFNRGIAALRGTGLVYDLLVVAHQLPETIAFVDRHPQQAFVLDHLGKPAIRDGEIATWRANIQALALRPNVCCKLSGLVTEADPVRWTDASLRPYFDVAVESFGPERLMIGTDWPVLTAGCSYAGWWQTVEHWIAPLSAEEQRHILGGTAARVYHLETKPQKGP